MTKCIVLGEQPTEVKKKPIEFVKVLEMNSILKPAHSRPRDYKCIELICKSYSNVGDVMFAYDDYRESGVLYFGKWNDGVAE